MKPSSASIIAVLTYLLARESAAAGGAPAPSLPAAAPVPAAPFRDQLRAAMAAEDMKGMKPLPVEAVAVLECAEGSSPAYAASFNAFSIHATSSWPGQVYVTGLRRVFPSYAEANAAVTDWKTQELLRVYGSLRESVRDFVRLISTAPRYQIAFMWAQAGDGPQFFKAMAFGDGKEGYVGPSNGSNAAAYVTKLTRTLERIA